MRRRKKSLTRRLRSVRGSGGGVGWKSRFWGEGCSGFRRANSHGSMRFRRALFRELM